MNKYMYMITGITLIIVVMLGQMLWINQHNVIHTTNIDNNDGNIALHVSLKVYKNGRLVFYDPDDPPTNTLFRLLAHILDGHAYRDANDLGDSDANGLAMIENEYIAIVTTSVPYSQSVAWGDISSNAILSSPITSSNIKTMSTTGDLVIVITRSITITSLQTIYAVGYVVDIRYNSYHDDEKNFLLLYDYLDNSISVSAGDVVTVVYEIHLPVSNQYPS